MSNSAACNAMAVCWLTLRRKNDSPPAGGAKVPRAAMNGRSSVSVSNTSPISGSGIMPGISETTPLAARTSGVMFPETSPEM